MKNVMLVASFLFVMLGFSSFVESADLPFVSGEDILVIRIIDFQSPARLGDFLNFQYYLKDVSGVNDAVIVDFWVEKSGEEISSGHDNFYLSDTSNTTIASKVFLPSNIESGIYRLNIKVSHKDYVAESYRTIEIRVKNGVALISPDDSVSSIDLDFVTILHLLLVLLVFLNIAFTYYLERKKINSALVKEKNFFKKYKLSLLTFSFFVIIGIFIYYLNSIGKMPDIPLYLYFLFLGIFLALTIININFGKHFFKRFGKHKKR